MTRAYMTHLPWKQDRVSGEPKDLDLITQMDAVDVLKVLRSLPPIVPQLLSSIAPYSMDFLLFGLFVYWNEGIVLGRPLPLLLVHI